MATVFFVDTNFFLQLDEPRSLRWKEITDDDELVLMVSRTVQSELDRLKQDGNSRRARRARECSSSLRQVIRSPACELVVRDANPRVCISFPPVAPRPNPLGQGRADDQLVGEVLDFLAHHQSEKVFLLTGDLGPMHTAREHSVPFKEIPEHWLRSPEPDERDKTIKDLKARLVTLERTHPQISISGMRDDGEIDRIDEPVASFEPLSEAAIDRLTDEIRIRCPLPLEFGISGPELALRRKAAEAWGGRLKYIAPTDAAIAKYREETYPGWLARVRQRLKMMAELLNSGVHTFEMRFRVTNTGTVPASNTVVDLRAHGDVLIRSLPSTSEEEETIRPEWLRPQLPSPPSPPRGSVDESAPPRRLQDIRFDDLSSMHAAIPRLADILTPARDRYAFHWDRSSAKPTEFLRLVCEEFRHHDKPEDIPVLVVLPRGREIAGAVSCRLSATNLPEPKTLLLKARTAPTMAETEVFVRELIQRLPPGL